MTGTTVAPVRKVLEVDCAREHAFRTFTEGIDTWWPRAEYSIAGGRCARVVFEPRVGGSIYEVSEDDVTSPWGTVLAFDPPARIVFEWHPGSDRSRATEVEVRFTELGSGTRVHLEHRNWHRLGARAAARRDEYERGWAEVLQTYCARAARDG